MITLCAVNRRDRKRADRRTQERKRRKARRKVERAGAGDDVGRVGLVANNHRRSDGLFGHFSDEEEMECAIDYAESLDWTPHEGVKMMSIGTVGGGVVDDLTFSVLSGANSRDGRVVVGAADGRDGVFFAWDYKGRASGPYPTLEFARAAAVVT